MSCILTQRFFCEIDNLSYPSLDAAVTPRNIFLPYESSLNGSGELRCVGLSARLIGFILVAAKVSIVAVGLMITTN